MRYRIHFQGTPIGSLNTAYKVSVTRIVEANSAEEAQLLAYTTNDHITGGAPGVSVEEIYDDANKEEDNLPY